MRGRVDFPVPSQNDRPGGEGGQMGGECHCPALWLIILTQVGKIYYVRLALLSELL